MQVRKTLHGGFDLVRVTAIFLVIVVHVCGEFFGSVGHGWVAVNIYDSLAHICVPLFFMLSGALIVPHIEPLSKTAWRVLKLVIPLIFWSYIYLAWYHYTGSLWGYHWNFPAPSVLDPSAILSIIASPVVFHFWFIYFIIGLYLFVPVLQIFFQNAPADKKITYLALWFVGTSIIPLLAHWASIEIDGANWLKFASYAGYMFTGAVLANFTPSSRAAVALSAVSILTAICAAYLTYLGAARSGIPNEFLYQYHLPFMLISAAAAFPVFSKLGSAIPPKLGIIVSSLSRATFGIYIVHPFVLKYSFEFFTGLRAIYPGASIPLFSFIIFGLSAIAVMVLRQVPGFKHYLLPG